jgi:uncharacterized membrane-anchored protein
MQPDLARPEPASVGITKMLNKVPEVTIYFWIIKILCTTVGETAADYLNVNLNFGLTGTSIVTGLALAVALGTEFAARKYVPWRYWITVALVSIFGTLVTDNLTDRMNVPLEASTIVFTVLLGLVFAAWYATDRTLSVHSIFTRRREAFYWLAVLVSFALGTASGDLVAERLGVGYARTGLLVAGLIAITAVLWRRGLHPILAFWIVYIFTRPLGASIGDYLSQSKSAGGLGLGTTRTSFVFLGAILVVVVFLTITKADISQSSDDEPAEAHRGGVWQTAVAVGLFVVVSAVGYPLRKHALANDTSGLVAAAPGAEAPTTKLGDLSSFRTITQDSLDMLSAGNQSGATSRIGDLEHDWDAAQGRLQARDGATWTEIDDKIDTVLRELRAASPNAADETAALNDLLTSLV